VHTDEQQQQQLGVSFSNYFFQNCVLRGTSISSGKSFRSNLVPDCIRGQVASDFYVINEAVELLSN
jgi:hypothetical protein